MINLATFAEIVFGPNGKEYEVVHLPGRFDDYFVVGFLFAVSLICMACVIVVDIFWKSKLDGERATKPLRYFIAALRTFAVLVFLAAPLYLQHLDERFELRPVVRQPAAIQTPPEEINDEEESQEQTSDNPLEESHDAQ